MAMSKIWGYLGCMQMGFSGVFLKSPFPIKTRHHHHLGEFFCTIWLIRQFTNEGWFVSLLPENVSIFEPSFFSISSPSKMSLTSRPNICYYWPMYHEQGEVKPLIHLRGWKIREKIYRNVPTIYTWYWPGDEIRRYYM